MAKKQSQAVATRESAGMPSVPEYMKKYAGTGTENIKSSDIAIPRIKLLQMTSPEVQEGEFKAGQFFHDVMEVEMGASLKMIPVYIDIRYMLWRPRHDGGGILARADDGVHWTPSRGSFTVKPYKDISKQVTWVLADTVVKSGLDSWGTYDPDEPNSPPAATKMYNIAAIFPDFPELSPAIVTLQRSATGVGKKMFGKLKLSQAPIFGLQFNMESAPDVNASGQDFWNYKFTGDGFVSEELMEQGRQFYERFSADKPVIRDEETLQEDGDAMEGAVSPPPSQRQSPGKSKGRTDF